MSRRNAVSPLGAATARVPSEVAASAEAEDSSQLTEEVIEVDPATLTTQEKKQRHNRMVDKSLTMVHCKGDYSWLSFYCASFWLLLLLHYQPLPSSDAALWMA